MEIRFILPYPPSVNEMYFIDRKRGIQALTPTARKYKAVVTTALLQSGLALEIRELLAKAPVLDVTYTLLRPTWTTKTGAIHTRLGDTDGAVKAVKDAIFKAIGVDDAIEYVTRIEKKTAPQDGLCVTVGGYRGAMNESEELSGVIDLR